MIVYLSACRFFLYSQCVKSLQSISLLSSLCGAVASKSFWLPKLKLQWTIDKENVITWNSKNALTYGILAWITTWACLYFGTQYFSAVKVQYNGLNWLDIM